MVFCFSLDSTLLFCFAQGLAVTFLAQNCHHAIRQIVGSDVPLVLFHEAAATDQEFEEQTLLKQTADATIRSE